MPCIFSSRQRRRVLELYYEIAKYKGYGVPKRYKKAVNKYFVVENLFFFESNLARQYSGNPRYIYEKLIERFPNFIYVWAYDGNPKNIPDNPIVVKRSSNEYIVAHLSLV